MVRFLQWPKEEVIKPQNKVHLLEKKEIDDF